MTRSPLSIIVATLLAACASSATQTGTHTDRVIDTNAGARVAEDVPVTSETTVNASPDSTLAALDAAYSELGIEVKLRDSKTGEIGNRKFSKVNSLAGQSLSSYVGCGWTSVGPAADNYRITMSLVSRVTPNGTGSSVETRLTAFGEDISSKGTVSCATRGRLERRVHELALKHLGG
jgi:hypothetical protein